MNALQYRGKLKNYLQAPLYMIVVFSVGCLITFFFNFKIAMAISVVTLLYAILVLGIYYRNQSLLEEELISFATKYGTVQKEFLNHFQLPYGLLDVEGKFIWQNKEFCRLTGKERYYSKSITSVFPEITRELIAKSEGDRFCIRVQYQDKILVATFQKIDFQTENNATDMIVTSQDITTLYAVVIEDETELFTYKKQNAEQKMAVALLYIDNYEETVDAVDIVKQALLAALIDRKINRYFQDANAIVRKMEKDKYFIILQNQYLEKLKNNNFSILEEMKTVKIGAEKELTVSIGIGANGITYQKNADDARAAIDLALGRGGSQVVIKDNGQISYYGVRGKEIEKNTRVKARVKAQALREIMESREQVIVMGHKITDVDALGAAIALYCTTRELQKSCHIVLETVTSSLRPLLELFTEEAGYPEDLFINGEEAQSLLTPQTLLVVVDTNRPNYTECPELLRQSKSIVVFDHHRQGNEKIENPILSYIEPYASSTCEMLAEVVQYFSDNIKISPMEADCIYAGVLIDTNNFMTKTGVRTFEAAAYLRRCGAEVTRVRKMLREDMTAYKARAEVVRHAQVYRTAFAISVCESRELESPTIVGAQAANELLNIVGIKASFVLTEYQNKIFVSSRSIDEIDVQLIMERLGGGGHLNVAGAQIMNRSVEEVEQEIRKILDDLIDEGEIKI